MLRGFLKAFEDIMYVERFSVSNGVLQKIDPRVKLCSFIAFILVAVATTTVTPLIILSSVIIALSVLSRIPLRFFFLRATVFIPIFTGIMALPLLFITPGTQLAVIEFPGYVAYATWEGAYRAVQFTFKVWVCVASLTLFVLTTPFSKVLHAIEKFGVPKIFVMMTAVTYRFIFIFVDEAYRMLLAREARTVAKEKRLRILRSLGSIITTLFIRAYERGEKTHLAMLARGYRGEAKSLGRMKCGYKDWAFGIASILICLVILLAMFTQFEGI
jgi:cobalt/nickel transport system permease protein